MKSLNKVELIGNVTKDVELKYTPAGTAVCTFMLATNRDWKDSSGQRKEEATFNRVVTWSKLAEIVSQYVKRGSKIYVSGRLSNRTYVDKVNVTHYITEVVADEMILLDSRRQSTTEEEQDSVFISPEPPAKKDEVYGEDPADPEPTDEQKKAMVERDDPNYVNVEDIPF